MKTYSPAYYAHKRRTLTTVTRCSRVEKKNGDFVLGTELDRDVTITSGPRAGLYRSIRGIRTSDIKATSDMSITNMEMTAVVDASGIPFAFTAEDVNARQFDTAPVEVFELNYEDPDDFQDNLVRGFIGQIQRTAEGAATMEIRGLWQKGSQLIGRTDGDTCDVARFGDARCKLNIDPFRFTGTVTEVTTRRLFRVTFDFPSPLSGVVRVWDLFPFDIEIGDLIAGVKGCDRTFGGCLFYDNTLNFHGHGHWAPGISAVVRSPQLEGTPVPEVAVPQSFAFGEIRFTSGDNDGYETLIQRVDLD